MWSFKKKIELGQVLRSKYVRWRINPRGEPTNCLYSLNRMSFDRVEYHKRGFRRKEYKKTFYYFLLKLGKYEFSLGTSVGTGKKKET